MSEQEVMNEDEGNGERDGGNGERDGGNGERDGGNGERDGGSSEIISSTSNPFVVNLGLSDADPFKIAFSNENNNPIRIDSVENWYWKFFKHCVPVSMAGLVALIAYVLNPFSIQNQKIHGLEYTLKVIGRYYDAKSLNEKKVYRGIIKNLKANNETAEFIKNFFGQELDEWLKYTKKKEKEIVNLKNENEKLEKQLEDKENKLKKKEKDLKTSEEKLANKKKEIQTLTKRNQTLTKRNRIQNKKKLDALSEKNRLELVVKDEKESIIHLRNAVDQLKKNLKKSNEKRRKLISELSESHSTILALRGENSQLSQKNGRLRKENEILKERLHPNTIKGYLVPTPHGSRDRRLMGR